MTKCNLAEISAVRCRKVQLGAGWPRREALVQLEEPHCFVDKVFDKVFDKV